MKNKKLKLVAYFLTTTVFLTGCKKDITSLFEGSKAEETEPHKTYVTMEVPTTLPDISKETIDAIIEDIEETRSEETIVIEEPTTEEPVIEEPTEPSVEQPPIIEETTEPEPSEEPIPPIDPPNNPEFQELKVGYPNYETELYAGTATNSQFISCLNIYDATYRIVTCENGWDLVKQNNNIGYVQSDRMTYTEDLTDSEYIHLVHNDIVITTSSLNFRTGPSKDFDRIGTFKENTELRVVAEANNGWLLVRHNGVLGYVNSGYTQSMLARAQELYPELNITEINPQKVVMVNANLNLRCGNSIDFYSLGILEKYETLRVLGEYDGWYFVMTNDYNFGFVSKSYTEDLTDKYVIVDKSEQRLYLYNNNDLLYVTPVTTGKDETPSDTGMFKILNKDRNVVLTDNATYWSPVEY